MDLVELSRLQFAITVMYHFLFVPLTLGLAWILVIMEAVYVMTGKEIYRDMTQFWGKLFGINFALGVTTGITMEFQFGTNWSRLSERAGAVLGPLLSYEVLTAFFLEAGFLGVMLFGANKVRPLVHFFCTCMVALGTMFSSFWIMANNSWMQVPVGHTVVDGRVADAEKIPYEDNTFDLVVGHAVLHHIPDVELSLREVLRVLKPGGRFVFAGEPSTIGDFYARWMSRATWWATTNITKFGPLQSWRRPQEELDESSRAAALEAVVDIHTFDPDELAGIARSAGATEVKTATEELAAAMLGWPVRTFEAAVPADKLGWGWAGFAFGGWKKMTWLDENVLRKVVPQKFFYNVVVTGVKPE